MGRTQNKLPAKKSFDFRAFRPYAPEEIHSYKRTAKGEVVRLKSVNTIPKIKLHKSAVHSITAVCGEYRKPFMDVWRVLETMRIMGETPEADAEYVLSALWKFRKDIDGSQIKSNDFGTKCHESMERGLSAFKKGELYRDGYSPWCEDYIQTFTGCLRAISATEEMVIDDDYQVGGTLDLRWYNTISGEFEMSDFKFRSCKEGQLPIDKAYETDLIQLAAGAKIVQKNLGLSYIPRISSVIVDVETKAHAVKCWTIEEQEWGLEMFEVLNKAFILRNHLYENR